MLKRVNTVQVLIDEITFSSKLLSFFTEEENINLQSRVRDETETSPFTSSILRTRFDCTIQSNSHDHNLVGVKVLESISTNK